MNTNTNAQNPSAALTQFSHEMFGKIRTLVIDDKIYFVAKDVAKSLGYSNSRDAIIRHCRGVVKHDSPTSSGTQEISFIPQGDVIRLVMRSKLPSAERFESWVCDEVIPTILRTGTYSVPGSAEPAPPLNVLGEVEHRIREFPITCKRHVGAYEALLFLHARITSGALTAPVKPSRIYEGFLLWLRCIGEMQAAQGRRSAVYTNREIAAMNPPGSPTATSRHLAQIEGQPVKIDASHILTVLPTRSRHTRAWEFRLEKTNGLALVP